ncbi:hypothetical protein [Streptomyces sp. NPDC002132]|uniref:hypothetical protein n=1 Tax=unclassified Streptomyces TaxID=2593676 RepID=UPI003323F7AA
MYRIAIVRKGQPTSRRTCHSPSELRDLVGEMFRAAGETVTDADRRPLAELACAAQAMADAEGISALAFGSSAITIRPASTPSPAAPAGSC